MGLYRGLPYTIFERIFFNEHVEGGLSEVQFYGIRTLLMNDDEEGALSRLLDWGKLRVPPPPAPKAKTCEICKFVPGTHHYVLGVKFDTLEAARAHAAKKGYTVTRVFDVDGSGANAASLREVLRKRGEDE